MKTIYLDTEFSEGFYKPTWWLPKWFPGNKPRWSIELISIGLVDNDGNEYYAINKDFDRSRCNDWVKKNVLTKLPPRVLEDKESWWYRNYGYDSEAVLLPNPVYKTIEEIRDDILAFVIGHCDVSAMMGVVGSLQQEYGRWLARGQGVQFKAYYADYDWVLFCTIFGNMNDLPTGFPMYCFDLKQTLDEAQIKFDENPGHQFISELTGLDQTGTRWASVTIDNDTKEVIKKSWPLDKHPNYPKQVDEHSSICDARFNKQLDEFLKNL